MVKLPGDVEANASTGQLTTTFAEDPQLPFSEFKLHFRGGPARPAVKPARLRDLHHPGDAVVVERADGAVEH